MLLVLIIIFFLWQKLAEEIKAKLESARKAKASIPKEELPDEKRQARDGKEGEDNTVVLTRYDKSGQAWPVEEQDGATMMSSSGGKRKRKKLKLNTHDRDGQRERYFADDDRHDLKALVEREKKTSAQDQNSLFSRLAGKVNSTRIILDAIYISWLFCLNSIDLLNANIMMLKKRVWKLKRLNVLMF